MDAYTKKHLGLCINLNFHQIHNLLRLSSNRSSRTQEVRKYNIILNKVLFCQLVFKFLEYLPFSTIGRFGGPGQNFLLGPLSPPPPLPPKKTPVKQGNFIPFYIVFLVPPNSWGPGKIAPVPRL